MRNRAKHDFILEIQLQFAYFKYKIDTRAIFYKRKTNCPIWQLKFEGESKMSTKIGRNDPCWCGSGKKYKKCHEAFDAKVEMLRQKGYPVLDHKLIKTPEQIEKIKESCKINVAFLTTWRTHQSRRFHRGDRPLGS